MSRVVWFFMILLALMTAPALCQSGVLEHDCGCLPGLSECSHESSCSKDPCGWFASATWRTALQTPSPIVASVPPFWAPRIVVRSAPSVSPGVIRVDLLRRSIETDTTVVVV